MARAVSAALDPVEPLEDVLVLLEGNAGPTISDRDRGTLVVVTYRDLDIPPTVLDGIVDEVGDRVEQEIPVANYGHHSSAALEFDVAALLFGRGVEQLGDLAGHLVQVDDREGSSRIQRLDVRDPQHRRKDAQHAVEFSHRVGDE